MWSFFCIVPSFQGIYFDNVPICVSWWLFVKKGKEHVMEIRVRSMKMSIPAMDST